MPVITREVEIDATIEQAMESSRGDFSILQEDRVVVVVHHDGKPRAFEQFGHRTDRAQMLAGAYLIGEMRRRLESGALA